MSLRSYQDQIASEDLAFAAFDESLGDALKPFETMTVVEVAESGDCPKCDAPSGQPCGISRHADRHPFNCIDRRIAAARATVAA